MKARWPTLVALALLAAGAALVVVAAGSFWGGDVPGTPPSLSATTQPPAPSAQEGVVPSPTPSAAPSVTPSAVPSATPTTSPSPTPSSTPTPSPSPTPAPTLTEPILPPPPTASQPATPPAAGTPQTPTATAGPRPTAEGVLAPRQRLGLGSGGVPLNQSLARRLGLGWYLDWRVQPEAYRSPQVDYLPMIRLRGGQIVPDGETLRAAARALPGALWLVGNEPDVKWQDNVTPEDYAAAYHHVYTLLKDEDPTCQVAIGGISQPTPLRLRYLERILSAYEGAYGEPLPVDVWNVHNFILREERGSWGVDIPPGLDEDSGRLYEIADHDDLEIFQQQIVGFRRWMAAQGQRDKPLIVTEYGILMPAEYGFPPDQVEAFMLDTFEFFRTATDPELGYPADGGRLVQRWCWYSLHDSRYPTGNLLDPDEGSLTPLGRAFAEYARSLE
ncbi:MAG: glycosyl hydrolase [Anaerolineae bacterium]